MYNTCFLKKLSVPVVSYIILLLCFTQNPLYARYIISELYRDPPGSESMAGCGSTHEFVEIANIGRDTLPLDSLFITNGTEADSIVASPMPISGYEKCRFGVKMLLPGDVALILDADYRGWCKDGGKNRFYIPDSTIILECGDSEFGSGGLASSHGAVIYRGTKSRIDSIICSAADSTPELQTPTSEAVRLTEPQNREGFSVCPVTVLSGGTHYEVSVDSINPGTVVQLRSGWILEYKLSSVEALAKTVACSLWVQCLAAACPANARWSVERNDGLRSSTVTDGTVDLQTGYGVVADTWKLDSVQVNLHILVADTPSWNIDMGSIWLPGTSLRITELFTRATALEPEWLEVYNCTAMPINLRNWRLCIGEDTATLAGMAGVIGPGAYMVIGKSEAALRARYRYLGMVCEPGQWISLDNTADTVALLDNNRIVREKICYDARRFAARSSVSFVRGGVGTGPSDGDWGAADRPTPGLPNGRAESAACGSVSLDIGPLPFTPDNDGRDDALSIRLVAPISASAAVEIYGFNGRLLRTFPDVTTDVVMWDGCGDHGAAAPGPFFVVAKITDGSKITRIRKKGILWRK